MTNGALGAIVAATLTMGQGVPAGQAAVPAGQSIEIDRTLQHVYGTAIMSSDIRQVRLLRLLPEADDTDDRILFALENRLLIVRELTRQPSAQPSAAAIAARRQAWAASWPPGTDLPALMMRAGMTDQALDGWFRDDLRIAAYLDLRFGTEPNEARAKQVDGWLADLRRRANLPAR
jgi:hypothetical protein